jgi:hypothetical protein
MVLLSAEDDYFEKRCPYGVPFLVGEVHHHVLLFCTCSSIKRWPLEL